MRVLITGSTGHIGSHLTLALLRRGVDVVAMARSNAGSDAASRVEDSLSRANDGHAIDLDGRQAGSLLVIDQDLVDPISPDNAARLGRMRIDALWHCAANTDLNPRRRFAMDHANVRSTEKICELAARLHDPQVFYVGTAYQCGVTPERVPEVPTPARPVSFRNAYEQSKWVGERLLWRSLGARLTVFRPSIVLDRVEAQRISDCAWQGFYAYVRKAHQTVMRRQRISSGNEAGILIGDAETQLDLVFVDRVVEAMVRVGLDTDAGGVFHLTARRPMRLGDLADDMTSLTGGRFEFRCQAPHAARLSPIQAAVAPYLNHGMSFDRDRVRMLLGRDVLQPSGDARSDVRRHMALAIGCTQSARGVG